MRIRPLTQDERRAFVRFVPFSHQRLFRLEPYEQPAPGHHLDAPVEREPVAHGAWVDGAPVGLALMSLPLEVCERRDNLFVPTLAWVGVEASHRGQGIGKALVTAALDHARDAGHHHAHVVYRTDTESAPVVDRLLDATGWESPTPLGREITFSHERLSEAPWLRRLPSIKRYRLVPWHDVSPELKQRARARHEAAPWIHEHLVFWDCEPQDAEPRTSVGILYEEALVGWVLTHAKTSRTLTFSQAFVRDDLAAIGLALPAAARALRAMPEAGFSRGVFQISPRTPRMDATVERHVLPWAESVTCRSERYLSL